MDPVGQGLGMVEVFDLFVGDENLALREVGGPSGERGTGGHKVFSGDHFMEVALQAFSASEIEGDSL